MESFDDVYSVEAMIRGECDDGNFVPHPTVNNKFVRDLKTCCDIAAADNNNTSCDADSECVDVLIDETNFWTSPGFECIQKRASRYPSMLTRHEQPEASRPG